MPKRSEERRRKNKQEGLVQATVQGGEVIQPRLRDGLHPLAVAWFESLARSGQSRWYEPSDWAFALILAEALDEWCRTGRGLSVVLNNMSGLLVTEGDRRRLLVELTRVDAERRSADEAADATVTDIRERLSNASS